MGRMPAFERTAVVTAARDLFWDRGFDAASLAELENATGLNRSSLYHAFGSKRGLFDAAVEDYLTSVIRPRLGILSGNGDGRTRLLAYFTDLRTAVAGLPEGSTRRGCLLVNCATGLAGHDEPTRRIVDDYRSSLTAALHAALDAAGAEHSLERARTLTALDISAMVIARVDAVESVALLDTALDQVRAWLPGQ